MKWLVCSLAALTLVGCKPASSPTIADGATVSAGEHVMTPDPIEGLEAIPGSTEVKRWEYDDGGFHIKELDLRADSTPDEIKAFYEPRLDAKEMPVTDGFVSIQNDRDGKHFEVNYSRGNDMKTVQILVKTPQP